MHQQQQQSAKPRKPRTKSIPADGRRWRRVWNETNQKLPLSSEDLATKQSKVARRNGLRPPTFARRYIDSTGGPRCRKWPYRCVRRIDRQIERQYKIIYNNCLESSSAVTSRALARISLLLKQRAELVTPVIITI
ncbi:hypothetical protein QKT49_gp057 [Acanthamoeba castellanii medusavirus]|uniref:Uncharacterized protein n=1 Tax=Acanthamoeba castellanii medusavirus J1 TaxID=3114988 RepID=A0A3T1CWI9_9VIRU|nr:hypothetical protein QKT49_gp057 [Acanthamoeba castellanii medusavirus]BBI30197.1 hypothetical protein [Acanthamoeba castellanii medusavirus J1]